MKRPTAGRTRGSALVGRAVVNSIYITIGASHCERGIGSAGTHESSGWVIPNLSA